MEQKQKISYMEPVGQSQNPRFDYNEAFSRNIGWVTEVEQQILKEKRIAIAGMGGVGGVHLLTLARMGFAKFHIADMDRFELANFNRQIGASMDSIGEEKTAVLENMAQAINPEMDIQTFSDGVTEETLEAFLSGVDLYVDGLDFFVLDIRGKIFAKCHEMGIPAITAAPVGMGAAYLIFMPGGMTFEQYFRLNGLPEHKQYVNFLLGLTPAMLQRSYIRDKSRLDFDARRGPSTPMACQMCAGVTATEAVKILLGRGKVRAAPHYHHFDPYKSQYVVGKLWFGNRNPLQTIKRHLAYRLFDRLSEASRPQDPEMGPPARPIERILDLARWAPSGDNVQPWRFEILSDSQVRIHCDLMAHDSVYEFNEGEPTKLALGMLLETIKIAASRFGWDGKWVASQSDGEIIVDYFFHATGETAPDPLTAMITLRSTDRRRYRLKKLSRDQKAELEASLGTGLSVQWFESFRDRLRMALVSSRSTSIRLTIPECHHVHKKMIDWSAGRFSRTGIPAAAVGLDPFTTGLMKWLMKDWRHMKFMNRTLGGAMLAAFQLDIVPGLLSANQFAIQVRGATGTVRGLEELLNIGASIQRFWLTAARFGLVLQPAFASLCFASHARTGAIFTENARDRKKAGQVAAALEASLAKAPGHPVFLGRIGYPVHKSSPTRSIRLPLDRLMRSR